MILIIVSKNTENAQEFLEAVVKVCFSFHSLSVYVTLVTKGHALHRIGDVLRFEGVDVSTGYRTGTLSFQRGYFPLFQFFSSNLVLKSTLHKNIKWVICLLLSSLDERVRIVSCMLS